MPCRNELLRAYRQTRGVTAELAGRLRAEDFRVQTMPDVSPPWWNLGHMTWFFARNILEPHGLYTDSDRRLEYCLNSYYESLGERLPRDRRGSLTRPTTEEILAFRQSVDERIEEVIRGTPEPELDRLGFLITTGIHHEQQHQELLVTEVKHILGSNPPELREAFVPAVEPSRGAGVPPLSFVPFEGGVHEIGNVEGGWCWDNELAVHRAFLEDYALSNRLVTNREYLEFMADGGYEDPLLWLSNGWARVSAEGWRAPLYWEEADGAWRCWTLAGDRGVDLDEPVCHLSFYEADAFARWKAAQGGETQDVRLPTEREWEHGARAAGFPAPGGTFLDGRRLHPAPAPSEPGLLQTGGDVWEWTSSHYEPYPRYRPFEGALMEYNGKFMDNQRVSRGGSCATPESHIRVSYRNFWPPETRFQFTGIRLAKTLA